MWKPVPGVILTPALASAPAGPSALSIVSVPSSGLRCKRGSSGGGEVGVGAISMGPGGGGGIAGISWFPADFPQEAIATASKTERNMPAIIACYDQRLGEEGSTARSVPPTGSLRVRWNGGDLSREDVRRERHAPPRRGQARARPPRRGRRLHPDARRRGEDRERAAPRQHRARLRVRPRARRVLHRDGACRRQGHARRARAMSREEEADPARAFGVR